MGHNLIVLWRLNNSMNSCIQSWPSKTNPEPRDIRIRPDQNPAAVYCSGFNNPKQPSTLVAAISESRIPVASAAVDGGGGCVAIVVDIRNSSWPIPGNNLFINPANLRSYVNFTGTRFPPPPLPPLCQLGSASKFLALDYGKVLK